MSGKPGYSKSVVNNTEKLCFHCTRKNATAVTSEIKNPVYIYKVR